MDHGLLTFLVVVIVSDATMLAYSTLQFLWLGIVVKVLPKGGSTVSSRCSAVGVLVDSSVHCCTFQRIVVVNIDNSIILIHIHS